MPFADIPVPVTFAPAATALAALARAALVRADSGGSDGLVGYGIFRPPFAPAPVPPVFDPLPVLVGPPVAGVEARPLAASAGNCFLAMVLPPCCPFAVAGVGADTVEEGVRVPLLLVLVLKDGEILLFFAAGAGADVLQEEDAESDRPDDDVPAPGRALGTLVDVDLTGEVGVCLWLVPFAFELVVEGSAGLDMPGREDGGLAEDVDAVRLYVRCRVEERTWRVNV